MESTTQSRWKDESIQSRLRKLYERRGFLRVKTSKFEEYALYVENKNFLATESIITFMDMDGKLMALKPDVTLSIVKNIPRKKPVCSQKVYYIDEVYRLSSENREYKVHNQIGLEIIGPEDEFSNLEIVDLAVESLRTIDERFVLDISHLGFVSGLLEAAGLSERDGIWVLNHIHAKNIGDISDFLEQAEIPSEMIAKIISLVAIHGDFNESLLNAKTLICNEQMQQAWQELEQVSKILTNIGAKNIVNLDFSVVNDLAYYNGIILRGYIKGVASPILTGGRYDNLLQRMGKKSCAVGFAIYLDELSAFLDRNRTKNLATLVTYSEECNYADVILLVKEHCAKGERIRIEREDSDLSSISYSKHFRYINGVLVEVKQC